MSHENYAKGWKANLGFLGDWTTQDSCTYLVKQEVTAPYIRFDNSANIAGSDVSFHYVEWSDHAKATFATDPKYSPWPPISSSKPNIDDDQETKYPDLQKTANGYFNLPNFKQEIATGVYSLVPGSTVLEWMSDFSKKHEAYKFSR